VFSTVAFLSVKTDNGQRNSFEEPDTNFRE